MGVRDYRDGLITQVFYNRGRVEGDNTKKRFVKAPFCLIKFSDGAGELFIMTDSTSFGEADKYTDDPDGILNNGWGYLTLQDILISEHEMGCWQDADQTWKSCNAIGLV